MGLDLYLLPITCETETRNLYRIETWGYSHTIIDCDANYPLFQAIEALEKTEGSAVPKSFTTFLGRQEDGEHGYGETHETPYGKELRAVRVKALLPFFKKAHKSHKNRAAWAYLTQLPPEMRIALYWH